MSKRKSDKAPAVRTTISWNPLVDQWAKELQEDGGFNSLSDLLADLVRRRKELKEDTQKGIGYPPHREQVVHTEEGSEDRPKKGRKERTLRKREEN